MFAIPLRRHGLDLHAASLSAIDNPVGTSDKTGRRTGQKRHRFGHFVRAAEAPHGHLRQHAFEDVRSFLFAPMPDAIGRAQRPT
jgi:hypothetical protein